MGYIEELRALIGHRRVNLAASIVVIPDGAGRILMQQRAYPRGKWGLPGGLLELGESAEDAARREVYEETGMRVDSLALLGVYSGPDYLCMAANSDEWYTVEIAYIAREYHGEPIVNDDESLSFAWFDRAHMPANLASTHGRIISDYFSKTSP